jgi:hypothetical protein
MSDDDDTTQKSVFERKLEERRRRQHEADEAAKLQQPQDKFQEDVPELDLTPHVSQHQQVLDDFIKGMTIVSAYQRWSNKTPITSGNRREIKVSCPNPQHPDKEKSASLNTEKDTYYCFTCDYGGDLWDIAAFAKGYPVPGYKQDPKAFRELRAEIGRDFGIEATEQSSGTVHVKEEDLPPPTPIPTAVMSHELEEEFEKRITSNRTYAEIDWRSIVPKDTFLHEYLKATTTDDCPEEFHFWNGLVALGLGAGRSKVLEDSPLVLANLFVCLTGGTGTGKSKAKGKLTDLLKDALAFKRDDPFPKGTKKISGAQSGEVIIKSFMHPILDPNGKNIGFFPGVRGFINFEELAEMISKAGRQGSTLKQLLMDLYDGRDIGASSLTHGEMTAEKPFGSVVTTTQLKSVRTLINRKDDAAGFTNRWVYATGKPKRQTAINRISYDFTRAAGLLRLINADSDGLTIISWEPEAENVWEKFFQDTVMAFKYANQDAEIAHRVDLLLKKLFLLFTINTRQVVLTRETVEAVLTLYPHLMETYQIIDDQIAVSQTAEDEDLVLRHIQRMTVFGTTAHPQDRGPTARELYNVVKRKIPDRAVLAKTLKTLEEVGLIKEIPQPVGPSGGRPTKMYVLKAGVSYVT